MPDDDEKDAAGPSDDVTEWLGVEMKMKSCGSESRGDVCHIGLDATGEPLAAPLALLLPLLWRECCGEEGPGMEIWSVE